MSAQLNFEQNHLAQTEANLRELAAAIRDASHLEPDAQQSLANLLEEIGAELHSHGMSSTKTAYLADAVSNVARHLHDQKSPETLNTARDELRDVAADTAIEAPVATGIVYRFIDALASIGI